MLYYGITGAFVLQNNLFLIDFTFAIILLVGKVNELKVK